MLEEEEERRQLKNLRELEKVQQQAFAGLIKKQKKAKEECERGQKKPLEEKGGVEKALEALATAQKKGPGKTGDGSQKCSGGTGESSQKGPLRARSSSETCIRRRELRKLQRNCSRHKEKLWRIKRKLKQGLSDNKREHRKSWKNMQRHSNKT